MPPIMKMYQNLKALKRLRKKKEDIKKILRAPENNNSSSINNLPLKKV